MIETREVPVTEYEERIVDIARVAKVHKGGRSFAFRVVAVVGDRNGRVGVGIGKARAVPEAMRKATERARRNMKKIALLGTTIPHPVTVKFGATRLILRPASPGTGVIAAGGVRAVLEAAGIRDVLTKILGSTNPVNVVYATMKGLEMLRSPEEIAQTHGRPLEEIMPPWSRKRYEA
ncbi:MAG: 30S ribosomal protein S5 [Anaerolineae bacterium]|nr:30S ribosomal protein S5 [Thermoflexus sp.]MDW8064999.1 30S ribosomal protein S5 [Anaerolineae bacterium]